jgi:plastocyanin
VVAIVAIVLSLLLGGGEQTQPRKIVITIPSGTAALVAQGHDPHVVPQRIRGTVGDTLEIVNNDRAAHTVGPFLVAAHQRIAFPLRRAGVFTGSCSLHPNDRIALIVRE